MTPGRIAASVEESIKRLQTDVIDVIQFHGGMYSDAEVDRILNGGLVDALDRLRDRGLVRFVGFTVEEPWTARPLIASGRFDCAQICYNLIYQAAARHVLNETREARMGVSIMRPMTSGILQRIAEVLAPDCHTACDLYELALKFVLSDSRVHVANVGMRSPDEVGRNVALSESFAPPTDMADLPRSTAGIYKTDDEAHQKPSQDS